MYSAAQLPLLYTATNRVFFRSFSFQIKKKNQKNQSFIDIGAATATPFKLAIVSCRNRSLFPTYSVWGSGPPSLEKQAKPVLNINYRPASSLLIMR